jgi:tetratricopeptide (TPR) repeat protein
MILPELAWAYLETGAAAKAEALMVQSMKRAKAQNMRVVVGDLLRIHGIALTRQGREDEAERSLQEGLALTRAMCCPYAEARVLYEWGRMRARKGEPQPARAMLQEALAIFQRLGARPYLARTKQALAELG